MQVVHLGINVAQMEYVEIHVVLSLLVTTMEHVNQQKTALVQIVMENRMVAGKALSVLMTIAVTIVETEM